MRTLRAHPQLDVLGEAYTNISIAALAQTDGNRTATLKYGGGSPFDASQYVDRNGKYFPNWPAYYGPVSDHDDTVTSLFTWDVSDTVAATNWASPADYFDVTGYGPNTPAPPRTFDPANIVILSNGQCSSSCTTLSHFLKWQGKVKSIVMGGRPNTGPMQHPGGIKGGTVLTYTAISKNAKTVQGWRFVPKGLFEKANQTKLVDLVRLSDYVQYRTGDANDPSEVSVNFANSVLGNEAKNANPDLWGDKGVQPLQYLYEAADCRLFYTLQSVFFRAEQWNTAANQAFGFNGTEVWSGCVEGSYGHETSLSGDEKLFNGGQPVNATDFDPANVGDGNVDVSVFNLEGNGFIRDVSATGTQTGDQSAPSETGSPNAGVVMGATTGLAMIVAGVLVVMMLL
jgi:hypothetical protein